MIRFKCPKCRVEMEISDRKAGKFVECLECGDMIEVREKPFKRARIRDTSDEIIGKDHLTIYEYLIYGALSLVFPVINLIVASFLYYIWKEERATKAFQVLQLTSIIFVIQLLPFCCLCVVPLVLGPTGDRRVRRRF